MAILLKVPVKRIEIYPFGGCSKLAGDVNIPLWKELLILVMGPMSQILFFYLITNCKVDVESYYFSYHSFILFFNLLPIYPLDGGKLLLLLCSYFISYYRSLKLCFSISYFIYISILFLFLHHSPNLFFLLALLLLGIQLWRAIKEGCYLFYRFLMERYYHHYVFTKKKKIFHFHDMKRDYLHEFSWNGKIISEREMIEHYYVNIYGKN